MTSGSPTREGVSFLWLRRYCVPPFIVGLALFLFAFATYHRVSGNLLETIADDSLKYTVIIDLAVVLPMGLVLLVSGRTRSVGIMLTAVSLSVLAGVAGGFALVLGFL